MECWPSDSNSTDAAFTFASSPAPRQEGRGGVERCSDGAIGRSPEAPRLEPSRNAKKRPILKRPQTKRQILVYLKTPTQIDSRTQP